MRILQRLALKTCKHRFSLTNFSRTCSLNLQLLWRVTPSTTDYYTVEYCKFAHNACVLFFFLTTSSLHLLRLQIILFSLWLKAKFWTKLFGQQIWSNCYYCTIFRSGSRCNQILTLICLANVIKPIKLIMFSQVANVNS